MARKVMHQFKSGYTPDTGEIDLRRLREATFELMEKCARAILCDGYDLDDAELERLVTMRYAGDDRTLTVPIESLTDTSRLLAPFHAAAEARFGESSRDSRVEIVGLCVQVVVDPDIPFSGSYGR